MSGNPIKYIVGGAAIVHASLAFGIAAGLDHASPVTTSLTSVFAGAALGGAVYKGADIFFKRPDGKHTAGTYILSVGAGFIGYIAGSVAGFMLRN